MKNPFPHKQEKISGKMNRIVLDQLEKYPYYKVKCNIPQVLKDRGLKRLEDLSDLTGIRTATLSEMINMRRTTLNVHHIIVIATALKITDISEMFTFEMDKETFERFEEERKLGVTREMEITMERNKRYLETVHVNNKKRKDLENRFKADEISKEEYFAEIEKLNEDEEKAYQE